MPPASDSPGQQDRITNSAAPNGGDLDRWADANAALAGTMRRAFIGRVR